MAGDEYHRGNMEAVKEKAAEGNYIAAIETAMEEEPHMVEYVASAAQQDPSLTNAEKLMIQDKYEELIEGTVGEHPAGPYSPEDVEDRIDALAEHREYDNALRLAASRAPDKLQDVAEEAIRFYEDEDTTGHTGKADEIRDQYLSDAEGSGRFDRARETASEWRDDIGMRARDELHTAGTYVGGVAEQVRERLEGGREALDEYWGRRDALTDRLPDEDARADARERLGETAREAREDIAAAWDHVTSTGRSALAGLFDRSSEPEGVSGLPARTEDFEGLPEPGGDIEVEEEESQDYISRTVEGVRARTASLKSALF